MEVSAWTYVMSHEDDRIMEKLLSGTHEVVYEIDPPVRPAPGSTVLHFSCNTLSIPHICYLIEDVFKAMQLEFLALGGPENCCGAPQWAFGDEQLGSQTASLVLGTFQRTKATYVVSTCPDCDIIFQMYRKKRHTFTQLNVIEFLAQHLDQLKSLLVHPVNKRVIIHAHNDSEMRKRDAQAMRDVLSCIPGLEILDAKSADGVGNHCLVDTGKYKSTLFEPIVKKMFDEAVELKADTIIVPYHGCYRQHCKRQLQYGVEVSHYISLIAASIGLGFEEKFKELRMLDDIDVALDRVKDVGHDAGYTDDEMRRAFKSKLYV